MKLALPSAHYLSQPFPPGSPSLHRAFPGSPAIWDLEPRGGSPARSRRSLPRAGSAARPGGTGHAQRRPRGQVCFAGARTRRPAGARLQLELGRLELELPGVSLPLLPLRARQPKPAREPREAAGQQPTQQSLVRSPEPRAGQPPGSSLAGRDACRALALPGHEPGCTVGSGRGERAGEAADRPGGDAAAAAAAIGAPGARSDEGGWGRDPAAGPEGLR